MVFNAGAREVNGVYRPVTDQPLESSAAVWYKQAPGSCRMYWYPAYGDNPCGWYIDSGDWHAMYFAPGRDDGVPMAGWDVYEGASCRPSARPPPRLRGLPKKEPDLSSSPSGLWQDMPDHLRAARMEQRLDEGSHAYHDRLDGLPENSLQAAPHALQPQAGAARVPSDAGAEPADLDAHLDPQLKEQVADFAAFLQLKGLSGRHLQLRHCAPASRLQEQAARWAASAETLGILWDGNGGGRQGEPQGPAQPSRRQGLMSRLRGLGSA